MTTIKKVPNFSTNISDAWLVVEWLRANTPTEELQMSANLTIMESGDGWWVGWTWHEWAGIGVFHKHIAEAICLLGLKVHEINSKSQPESQNKP